MHKSITRTEDEIRTHYNFIQNEIKTRVGTFSQLSKEIPVLEAISDVCYAALNLPDFDPNVGITYAENEYLEKKFYSDTCLWLLGKFYTAPNYKPLYEKQFSVEQVLEDFGNTSYNSFTIG